MTHLNFPGPLDHSTPPMNEKPFSQDYWDEKMRASQKTDPNPRKEINPQAHPKHYNQGKYEVIDVIEDWRLGFNLGNVIKYIARADHKGTPTPDLYKALFYLNREIALRENPNKNKYEA